MWRLLRGRSFVGFKFRRQVPFKSYILDFVCFERRIVVEIDGGQHVESSRDVVRDRVLRGEGFETIRYWNNDVLSRPASVLEDLLSRLSIQEADPSPRLGLRPERPSPTRGEGKSARGAD
jgi:very-short-patch-repair endonuclease